jgi:hypothetical protein
MSVYLVISQPTSARITVADQPAGGWVLLAFLLATTLATIGIYIEEVSFIMKTFKIPKRKKNTIWILAFFPVNFLITFDRPISVCQKHNLRKIIRPFFNDSKFNFLRLYKYILSGRPYIALFTLQMHLTSRSVFV